MVERYRALSALAHRALAARTGGAGAAEAGVRLGERPFRGMIALRGDAGDPAFLAAVEDAVGLVPPTAPNTIAATGDGLPRILWLGPDEWLVVTAEGVEAGLVHRLSESLGGRHAAVVDVSDGRTVIALAGPRARDVLAKGCPLDLHPRAFAPGRCAQTLLAKAAVILDQVDDAPGFEIYVPRSFADYLWRWLEDAAEEYGIAIAPD